MITAAPSPVPLLRCPQCGGAFDLDPATRAWHRDGALWSGVLACACCAYPVVEGIPYVRVGAEADAAMEHLQAGRDDAALCALLGLDDARGAAFVEAHRSGSGLTFRRALAILSPNAEGTYLLHRFSDPTFLASRALVRAVVRAYADDGRPVLDLACGTGHLASAVAGLRPAGGLVVADLAFWKVWLATQFVAPGVRALCCDANEPLPFAADAFAVAYCGDAFHYVWQRRRCADELSRLVGARGAVVLAHVHNALAENHSAGMPLTPARYAALFERAPAHLFRDSVWLDAALAAGADDGGSDVARDVIVAEPADALDDEPALGVVAARDLPPLRPDAPRAADPPPESATLNPLYEAVNDPSGEPWDDASDGTDAGRPPRRWRLRFPSPAYEEEYGGAARRYLPEQVTFDDAQAARARAGEWDDALRALLARRVLLELPPRYL